MTTSEEKQSRIDEIYNMLLVGFTRYQILKYVKTQTDWKISDAMVDKYIKSARDIIKRHAKEYEEEQFELSVNRLEDLYHKLETGKKYKEALEVLKEKNKLCGLLAPERKSIKIENVTELSDEELIRIIENEQ